MSRNQLWLDACRSSALSLKAECGVVLLTLEDLANDGINRLLALLVGYELSHLKILNGTELQCEITLPEMAVAICTFSVDGSPPGIWFLIDKFSWLLKFNNVAGIAVGAGSSLYIYKNFKPYYKYNIPHGGPNYTEQVRELIQAIVKQNDCWLSLWVYFNIFQAEITQLAALSRSTPDVSCSSLLLVGTGHHSLLIIDPHTFNAISRVNDLVIERWDSYFWPWTCLVWLR